MLSITFIALDSRADLPKVTYPTALDIYIIICYAFLLCCLCEFAMVHSLVQQNRVRSRQNSKKAVLKQRKKIKIPIYRKVRKGAFILKQQTFSRSQARVSRS